ncbi:MAG: hypothetical protein HY513_05300 [Candidatus Aenigmarchaeota archaeon]|nr:hypothetical protein [Candidatus Aenigmarchaeota archaeon]
MVAQKLWNIARMNPRIHNILEISPIIMILGGIALLVASTLGKYIALLLILAGIILLMLSVL